MRMFGRRIVVRGGSEAKSSLAVLLLPETKLIWTMTLIVRQNGKKETMK